MRARDSYRRVYLDRLTRIHVGWIVRVELEYLTALRFNLGSGNEQWGHDGKRQ